MSKQTNNQSHKFADVQVFGIGAYAVTQTDGTITGYVTGAKYERTTANGGKRTEFHSLARMIEDSGLAKEFAQGFNEYTSTVWSCAKACIIASEGFVKRFGIPFLPKEAEMLKEAKAELEAKRKAEEEKKTNGANKSETVKTEDDKRREKSENAVKRISKTLEKFTEDEAIDLLEKILDERKRARKAKVEEAEKRANERKAEEKSAKK